MKITVEIVKENKDGSANAKVDFDKEGLEMLVQEGLLSIIRRHIEQDENAREGMKLRKSLEKNAGGAKRVVKKNK